MYRSLALTHSLRLDPCNPALKHGAEVVDARCCRDEVVDLHADRPIISQSVSHSEPRRYGLVGALVGNTQLSR